MIVKKILATSGKAPSIWEEAFLKRALEALMQTCLEQPSLPLTAAYKEAIKKIVIKSGRTDITAVDVFVAFSTRLHQQIEQEKEPQKRLELETLHYYTSMQAINALYGYVAVHKEATLTKWPTVETWPGFHVYEEKEGCVETEKGRFNLKSLVYSPKIGPSREITVRHISIPKTDLQAMRDGMSGWEGFFKDAKVRYECAVSRFFAEKGIGVPVIDIFRVQNLSSGGYRIWVAHEKIGMRLETTFLTCNTTEERLQHIRQMGDLLLKIQAEEWVYNGESLRPFVMVNGVLRILAFTHSFKPFERIEDPMSSIIIRNQVFPDHGLRPETWQYNYLNRWILRKPQSQKNQLESAFNRILPFKLDVVLMAEAVNQALAFRFIDSNTRHQLRMVSQEIWGVEPQYRLGLMDLIIKIDSLLTGDSQRACP